MTTITTMLAQIREVHGLTVRPAVAEDLPRLSTIDEEARPTTLHQQVRERDARLGTAVGMGLVMVAEAPGGVAGMVVVTDAEGRPPTLSCTVAKVHRRHHVALTLCREVIGRLLDAGLGRVGAEVAPYVSNVALAERLGFEVDQSWPGMMPKTVIVTPERFAEAAPPEATPLTP